MQMYPQEIIGQSIISDFIKYIERKMILNCLVTKANLLWVEDIFGMDIGGYKEKQHERSPST